MHLLKLIELALKAHKLRKENPSKRKFRRFRSRGWLGGVCAGAAYSMGRSVAIVRTLFFIPMFVPPHIPWIMSMIGGYVLLRIFLPRWNPEPADFDEVAKE